MEKNIIYNSHKISILELIYSILLNYNEEKENIIEFNLDRDDLNYSSTFNLDSNLNFTQDQKEELSYDNFNVELIDTKYFNVDIYVSNKYRILKNNLIEYFSIKIDWELQKEVFWWKYIEDEEWNEIEIEKRLEIYYFKISCDIYSLKTKFIEYLSNEINNKSFYYGNGKIEELILDEFIKRGKDEIKISSKDLWDTLKTDNTNFSKYWNNLDLITIVFYNDVIELFLYKLYLYWQLGSIKINRDWKYEIKSKWITWKVIKDKNIENEIELLDWKIIYYKDKYLFYNPENTQEYNIKSNWNYDKLMDILIENIWSYVSYDDFLELPVYNKPWDSRDKNKRITDTKDNLQKNVLKGLYLIKDKEKIPTNLKFIVVNKWLKLDI